MIPLSLDEVRELCPGRLEAAPGAEWITGVGIDSRRLEAGDLFVAVGGGAEFAAEALRSGAAAVLVPDDPHEALAALGRTVRQRSPARLVGITGSTGKTSTKDILAALCRPHARTVAAEGGQNNELGLPLTLCRIEPDTELVVAELGMRGLGQIAALCEVARPNVGVITGVGPVHLELLGTVENVARAKAEIVEALPLGGVAVVPYGIPMLECLLVRTGVEYVRFGGDGDVRLERFEPPVFVADVAGTRVELEVPFAARHQAGNTLAALAAYHALGLPLEDAHAGAPGISFSRWRGDEHELPGGGLVINDAYNANPVSMLAAIAYLLERAERSGGRAVAVLGEMAELGVDSPHYHRVVGKLARRRGVDVIVAVGGELSELYAGDAHAPDVAAAIPLIRSLLEPGDVVLVKASRAAGLETVAEALTGVPA